MTTVENNSVRPQVIPDTIQGAVADSKSTSLATRYLFLEGIKENVVSVRVWIYFALLVLFAVAFPALFNTLPEFLEILALLDAEPVQAYMSLYFGMVVSFSMTVFGVLVTIDALSGPKESGFIHLLQSKPITRSKVYFARVVPTTLVMIGVTLLGSLIAWTLANLMWTEIPLTLFFTPIFGFCLLLCFFTFLGGAVSAGTSNSTTSIIVGVCLFAILLMLDEMGLLVPLIYEQAGSKFQMPLSEADMQAAAESFRKVFPMFWAEFIAENVGNLTAQNIAASFGVITIWTGLVYVLGDRLYARADL